jgi:CO/xanthine dehydrogenase Mo-binding subunit
MGRAAHDASVEVRKQILERAADQLEANVQDLEVEDGRVFVRGVPDRAISYAEILSGAMWVTGAVAATASFLGEPTPYDSAHVQGSLYPTFNSPSFHCHAAEVAVDPETGLVRVRNMVVAQDVGFAINPTYIEGQLQGGAAQAAGFAISEELHFDDGRIVNPNLALYKLPTAADAPHIKPLIVEHPSVRGLYGMKGVGEPPVIFGGAAIANAVFDAIGVQIHQTPLTPERVYRAVKSANE